MSLGEGAEVSPGAGGEQDVTPGGWRGERGPGIRGEGVTMSPEGASMSPWACSRVPGATMPRARTWSGHTCEPQHGSAHPRHQRRELSPHGCSAPEPPGLSRGATRGALGSRDQRGRSRDTAQSSPQGSGRRAGCSCPSWEVSPLQDVASSGHGDPAAPAWILRLRPCRAAAVEGGLRGRSAHGQSGGREGPVLLLLLGSHLPSSSLLLPQEGLSPPHPTEHPGADSGAWGARGVPAWQPRVGGGFWGTPWPGDPAAAPPAQAAPARGRLLPRCSVNQPQEGLVRAAPKNLIGTRAGRAGGAPDSKPRPGCTSCAPGGIHRAPPMPWLLPNPWEFRAFTALLLRSDLVRGIAATLGPLGGAGTGQSHLDVPTACSFALSPLLGALGPVPLSPSLPVCAPSQSCSSACPG